MAKCSGPFLEVFCCLLSWHHFGLDMKLGTKEGQGSSRKTHLSPIRPLGAVFAMFEACVEARVIPVPPLGA